MRKRIVKQGNGKRITKDMKEVALNVTRSGLNTDGSQRWVVSIRFANESHKKVSNTGFVFPEIDEEMNRMYFVEADGNEGYTLSENKNNSASRHFAFTIYDTDLWESRKGDYNLLRDVNEQLYYIEF